MSALDTLSAYPISSDMLWAVARGRIDGAQIVTKAGWATTPANAPRTLWGRHAVGDLPLPAPADNLQISSDAMGDANRTIRVEGLDMAGAYQFEDVDLANPDARVPALLTVPGWSAINHVWRNGGSDLAGNVYVSVAGAVVALGIPTVPATERGFIRTTAPALPDNRDVTAYYRVPLGREAVILGWRCGCVTSDPAAGRGGVAWLQTRLEGMYVWETWGVMGGAGSPGLKADARRVLPARADVRIMFMALSSDVDYAYGGFELLELEE